MKECRNEDYTGYKPYKLRLNSSHLVSTTSNNSRTLYGNSSVLEKIKQIIYALLP